jgi:hypothetical protein
MLHFSCRGSSNRVTRARLAVQCAREIRVAVFTESHLKVEGFRVKGLDVFGMFLPRAISKSKGSALTGSSMVRAACRFIYFWASACAFAFIASSAAACSGRENSVTEMLHEMISGGEWSQQGFAMALGK